MGSGFITMLAPSGSSGTFVAQDGTQFVPGNDGTIQAPIGYLGQLQAMGFTAIADPGVDPTTGRPTQNLQAGMPWFDSTLNIPIWRNAGNSGWINAAGSAV